MTHLVSSYYNWNFFSLNYSSHFSWLSAFDAGSGAINFIIDHAEIDYVFVQDKKVKEVIEHKNYFIGKFYGEVVKMTFLMKLTL